MMNWKTSFTLVSVKETKYDFTEAKKIYPEEVTNQPYLVKIEISRNRENKNLM